MTKPTKKKRVVTLTVVEKIDALADILKHSICVLHHNGCYADWQVIEYIEKIYKLKTTKARK